MMVSCPVYVVGSSVGLFLLMGWPFAIGLVLILFNMWCSERVAGWVGSPNSKNERRRVVTLLREGAVLGAVDKPVPGQIVDVRPSYPPANPDPLGHAVWRNGQALAVGYEGGPA